MKKAGINPIVGYGSGGASTPSGAVSAPAQATRFEDALGKGIASAIEARRLKQDLDSADAKIKLDQAATRTQEAQEKLNQASARKASADAKATETMIPSLQERNKYDYEKSKIDQKMLPYDAIQERANKLTGTISNAVDAINPFRRLQRGTDTIIDSRTGEVLSEKPSYRKK